MISYRIGRNMITEKSSCKIELFILVLILIVGESFFYLIDLNKINVGGSFNINDYGIALILIWGLILFKKYKNINIKQYEFKWLVLFIPVLVLMSSYQSLVLYGQTIMFGIRPQRLFIISYLFYFPFYKILVANKGFYLKVEKILFIIGGIALFLYTLQYLSVNKFVFLHVSVSQRFGGSRLQFNSPLLTVLPFITINNIINRNKVKFNTYFLIALSFYTFIIIKGRLASIALVVSIILVFTVHRQPLKMKMILIMFGSIIILLTALNSSTAQSYLASLDPNNITSDQNANIRAEGKKFYLNSLKESPILGRGFINILYKNAVKYSGIENRYFFNDNGVYAFYFFYGLIGVAWITILLWKFYIHSIKSCIKQNNYTYLGFALYITILLPNILYIYWFWGPLYTSILMALVEFNSKDGDVNIYKIDENT